MLWANPKSYVGLWREMPVTDWGNSSAKTIWQHWTSQQNYEVFSEFPKSLPLIFTYRQRNAGFLSPESSAVPFLMLEPWLPSSVPSDAYSQISRSIPVLFQGRFATVYVQYHSGRLCFLRLCPYKFLQFNGKTYICR